MAHNMGVQDVSSLGMVLSRFRNLFAYKIIFGYIFYVNTSVLEQEMCNDIILDLFLKS